MIQYENSIKSILEKSSEYLETRIDLVKLKTVDKSSDIVSSAASAIAIALGVLSFLSMASIGLAFYIGHLLGESYYGFFVMAGFYAVIALLLYIFRNHWIKIPLYNNMVRKILN
jgi:hypothetical protein